MLVISTSMSLGVITLLRENNNLYIVIIVGEKKKITLSRFIRLLGFYLKFQYRSQFWNEMSISK